LVNNNKADDADDKQEHVFVFLFVFLPYSESGRRSLKKKKKEKKGNALVLSNFSPPKLQKCEK
jgi:hypothetical protein